LQGYSGNRYNMSKALAADRPLNPPSSPHSSPPSPFAFLYAHCQTGEVFSSPNALAWVRTAGSLPGGSPRCALEAHPTPTGGSFWAAADTLGLFFTSNGAGDFSRTPGLGRAHTVAVGAPLLTGGEALVAVFGLPASPPGAIGEGGGDMRVLASTDLGVTWVSLVEAGRGLGNWPEVLVASRQLPGVIGVGSFGRGAVWTNASSALLQWQSKR